MRWIPSSSVFLRNGWVRGAVLAACLLMAYVTVWQPVRTCMLSRIAHPSLQYAASGNSSASVHLNHGAQVIQIHYEELRGRRAPFPAPAGVTFLLPGLFLCVLAPRRPVWFFFLLGHLGMSGLTLLGWTIAFQDVSLAVHVVQALGDYGIDAYSLMVPALVWVRESGIVEQLEGEDSRS